MDRSLAVFLRSLQTSTHDSDAAGLLPSATHLLVSLTNPLNVTLITSQLLSASNLWKEAQDLRVSLSIFSVFYTAALHLSQQPPPNAQTDPVSTASLPKEAWTKAVVKGADGKSPRWRHVLVLGAVLLGFGEKQKQSLPLYLCSKLESALVTAANLALQDNGDDDSPIGGYTIALVLNHAFEVLTDYNRAQLNYDLLLPVLLEATFSSAEGLECGYWLGTIDRDVVEVANGKFSWSATSNTYHNIQKMQERPLVALLGPMSRLTAHSVAHVRDSSLLLPVFNRLAEFARNLSISWRQNKLSEVDVSEELDFLDAESMESTLPLLWYLLRLSLFATVVVLRASVGRVLEDGYLSSDLKAPFLAMQCLHTLRNLYFVSSRLGQSSSSQYVFVSMVAIDILTQYPEQAQNFIYSIRPSEQGQIPSHPADRCLDLFFFNTAEHFTLTLSPKLNEDVVLSGAVPYLAAGGDQSLMEIFEAAHSAILSVLAGPHNEAVAAHHLPFYLDAVFKCFPDTLTARQFRLALRTMVRISSPPSSLAQSQPLLPSLLLETISERAKNASAIALPLATQRSGHITQDVPLSEQAVLVMTLIDSLCFLHPAILEEWLPLTASLVSRLEDLEMRRECQDRFWEAMSSGEINDERAALCVAWWSSKGGREQVLRSNEVISNEHAMSGALPLERKL